MSDNAFYPQDTLARPGEIRYSAQRLRAISGVLLGHGDNVTAVLNEVALSFSEVIASAVAAQIGNNVTSLESAVEGTEYGYAVGSSWADDVEAFIAERADLIAQWEAAELTDFGVPPLTGVANAEPEMVEQMNVGRDRAIDAARRDLLGDFVAEAARRWERFQDRAREKARMFREGPTAPNLALLTEYLGWGGMTLWPEMGTTPVTGAADGAAAASTVVAGLDGGASSEDVAEALSVVAMIVTRATNGNELTEAEMGYLEAFYGTMGDRIVDVPDYLSSASGMTFDSDDRPEYLPSVPFHGTPQLAEALTIAAANGLLVLSRPTARTDDDGHDGYERLPQWAREAFNPTALTEQEAFFDLVGMGDLLAYSTVEAGPGLSRELAMSVGWMIDFAEAQEHPAYPHVAEDFRAEIATSAPHLLDVVGRNDEVCFDLLNGSGMPDGFSPTDYFTDIYAFDWAVDDGAAAASLTDFIPVWATSDDPIAASRAEDAMFNLVQIVTDDAGFEHLMDGVGSSGIAAGSAVGQVNPAISQGFVAAMAPFMDQFAGPQVDVADPTGLRDLSFETRVRFTTLIGTDPESAKALAGLSYAYEQQELYEYVGSGNAEVNGGNVGRIRGIVDAGLINAEIDAGADQAAAELAAARTRQMGTDIARGLLGEIPVPGGSTLVDTVFAVINAQSGEDGATESANEASSPGRSEDERRYDTAVGVVTALVSTGQMPLSAMPLPFLQTVTTEPQASIEDCTQALVDAAAAAGFDLNVILNRIVSAYSDPGLVEERAG